MNLIGIPVGLVAGILAGLLGIGGGVILIPAMVLFMGIGQHTAQGVSLMVIAITALSGAFVHYRQNFVAIKLALLLTPGAVLFAFLGGYLAGVLDPRWLTMAFGLLTLGMGVRMVFTKA